MMKKLYFIFICLLAGCITHISKPIQSTEQIYAFMIENDKIYLVGEKSDYLLQNQDVGAMREFLNSPYAKQVLFFTMKLDSLDSDVTGEYAVYLDESKYNEEEKKQLQKLFWFNPISYIHPDLLPALQMRNTAWRTDQPALKRQYRAFGKRVRFKNRQEILQKYAMNEPMTVMLSQRMSSKEVIADDIALDIVRSITLLPVAVAYSTALAVTITPIAATMAVIYVINGHEMRK